MSYRIGLLWSCHDLICRSNKLTLIDRSLFNVALSFYFIFILFFIVSHLSMVRSYKGYNNINLLTFTWVDFEQDNWIVFGLPWSNGSCRIIGVETWIMQGTTTWCKVVQIKKEFVLTKVMGLCLGYLDQTGQVQQLKFRDYLFRRLCLCLTQNAKRKTQEQHVW